MFTPMLRSICFASLAFASSASAQQRFLSADDLAEEGAPVDETPIAEPEHFELGAVKVAYAEPANGGFNPQFAAVHVTGIIQAGGNACEASRYDVVITQVQKRGVLHVVPSLELKEDAADRMCPMFLDMNFQGLPFELTVRAPRSRVQTARLENFGVLNGSVRIVDLPKPPSEPVVVDEGEPPFIEGSCPVQSLNCTREYRPQVCSYNGQGAFVGNNPCEAKLNVQIAACAADGSYDVTLVDCVDDSSIR